MRLVPLILSIIALLSACGTRPPLPPECEGDLSPINAQADASMRGAIHESRANP